MPDEVTDPGLEGFSPEAFEPPGEGGLSAEQLALRIHLKREQAMQDAGMLAPPGPDEPLEEEPQVVEDEPEAEPEPEEEEPPGEEGDESEEGDEGEEGEEPVAELDEDGFYVATPTSKYKSREEAERGIAEKDRLAQAQFEELNQLRQQLTQLYELQQQQVQPSVFDEQAWSEWSAEVVSQGHGVNGAQRALLEGGQRAHDLYVAHWKDSDDPGDRIRAHAYDAEVTRQYAAQHAVQAVAPLMEQAQERGVVEEATTARQMAAADKPDFEELAPEMDRLIADQNGLITPEVKADLAAMAQGGGVHGKRMVWEYLYTAAKAASAPRRARATAVERKRRTTSAEDAKIAATVSTSEGSGTRTPLEAAELRELQKRNAIRKEWGQPLLEEP